MLPQETIAFRRLDESTLQTIFENKLSPEHVGFALMFEQGEHKAILSTLVLRPVEQTGILELSSLFTRPEVRRQGLARRLIAQTIEYTREHLPRYLYIYLQTVIPYLFERSGFTRTQILPKPTFYPYIVKTHTGHQLKTLGLCLAPRFAAADVAILPKSPKEDYEVFLGYDERQKEVWRVAFKLATAQDGKWILVDYGQSPRRYQEWMPVNYFRCRPRPVRPGASFSSKPTLSAAYRKRVFSACEAENLGLEPPAKMVRPSQPLPEIRLQPNADLQHQEEFVSLTSDSDREEVYSLLVESLSCVGESHLELCLFNEAEWRFEVVGLLLHQPLAETEKVLASVVVFRRHRQFNFIELAFFATRQELRKTGLGQRLFAMLQQTWREEKYEYILTFADFAAVPFFRKLNFTEEPVLPKVLYSSWIDRYHLAELMTKRLCEPGCVEDVTVIKPPLAVTVLVGKVNLSKSNKIVRKGWALAETDDLVCVEYEVWPRKHREWLRKDSGRWRVDKAQRNPLTHPAPLAITSAEEVMELHPTVMDIRKGKPGGPTQPQCEEDDLDSVKAESDTKTGPQWRAGENGLRLFGDEQETSEFVEVRIVAEESVAWISVPKTVEDCTQLLSQLMAVLREEQEVQFAAIVMHNQDHLPLLEELGFSCKTAQLAQLSQADCEIPDGSALMVAEISNS